MDKLLKEAIADAKAVRETALANAKLVLEEAFTPHLKSMLSKKLQSEEEGMEAEDEEKADESYHGEDEEEKVDENDVSSGIGASDNKEPGEAGDSSGVGQGPESEGSEEEEGSEDENLEKAPDQALGEAYDDEDEDEVKEAMEDEDEDKVEEGEHMDDEDEEVAEGEHMDDEDEDLAEVLRQLEAEMADEDEEGMEDEMHHEGEHMDDEDEEMKEEMEDEDMEDEDVDLDEIIKALSEEEGMEDEDEEKQEEAMVPATELEEYKQTVLYLKDKLSEVNLLNAKLLYTNKLFRSRNVSEEQKMKVIEQFDRAANVREVKLVFTTFAESMNRKSVNESAKRVSQASKPTASTQPKKKPIIGENTDFKSRMKKLANII